MNLKTAWTPAASLLLKLMPNKDRVASLGVDAAFAVSKLGLIEPKKALSLPHEQAAIHLRLQNDLKLMVQMLLTLNGHF